MTKEQLESMNEKQLQIHFITKVKGLMVAEVKKLPVEGQERDQLRKDFSIWLEEEKEKLKVPDDNPLAEPVMVEPAKEEVAPVEEKQREEEKIEKPAEPVTSAVAETQAAEPAKKKPGRPKTVVSEAPATVSSEAPPTNESKTLIVDTIDRLYTLCEEYFLVKINQQRKDNGEPPIDTIGDVGWAKGFKMVEAEFNRVITKLNFSGYPILFLCHLVEKSIQKKHMKLERIQPDLDKRAMPIIFDLSDLLICYNYNDKDERVLWMKPTEDRMCGCRGPLGKPWPDNINPTFEDINKTMLNITGKSFSDLRCIITIYGPAKIGKSSIASMFPNPVVADIENGWKFFNQSNVTPIRSWLEFLKWCRIVTNSSTD